MGAVQTLRGCLRERRTLELVAAEAMVLSEA